MITLSTFFGVCLFGHDSDRIRVRNEEGKLMLRCQSCNHDLPILADPVIYGPAHTPPEVKGMPTFVKTTTKIMERTCATAVVSPFAGGSRSATARRK